LVWAPYIHVGI